MIKLYFDENEIDKDYYRALSQSYILFDKSFHLGSVPSNTFRIELNNNANIGIFKSVKVELDNNDYAHIFYDNVDNSNGNKNIISLSDRMVDFEFDYDASILINKSAKGYVTILEILEDICSKKGVILATKDFNLKDKQITWYDSTISARKYISYIATLNGGFARINRSGELELVKYTNIIKSEINVNTCLDYKVGEHHKITRVVWDIGVDKWEYGDETGNTLYLDTDNPFITQKKDVESIYNLIKDFEFYSVKISKCPIDNNINIGDTIALRIGDTLYPFIAQLELNYNGGFHGGYSFIVNTEKIEETSANELENKIKSFKSRLNRDEAKLELISQQTSEQGSQIATLDFNYEEIRLGLENVADNKKLTGAEILLRINEDGTSEAKMNASKIKLEGYTTINKGFGVDLEGNAFMNGATINGGSIEMIDDGIEDEHSIKLYKGSDIEEVSRPIQVGDDLGGKILKLSFPNGFVGTTTGPSIAFENLIVCENGSIRYVNGYQYSEAINIWYEFNGENKDLFLDYYNSDDDSHNIQTNLQEITIPKGFGKVISVNSEIMDITNNKSLIESFTYSYKNIKYSTEFNSNGTLIKKK